jgi:hypothetical protein
MNKLNKEFFPKLFSFKSVYIFIAQLLQETKFKKYIHVK